ncbi:MAG: PHP domain-containing protein [Candidatus Heimdallarchaeota archaeon]|nr:PHP domain-containing protein [Candidatus Heimdallarchaeota archaeon]
MNDKNGEKKSIKESNIFLVDMHIHTKNSPDSQTTLEEILIELTGIVNAITITDHDFIGNYSKATLRALNEKYQIMVFTNSVEISTTEGDLLAYGISAAPSRMMAPEEIIDLVHSDGGLIVAAHPFTPLGIGDLVYDLEIDAIEINGSRPTAANQLAKEAAHYLNLPCVGGSDSHTQFDIATCVTMFTKNLNSIDDLISEIKKGNCSPLFLR